MNSKTQDLIVVLIMTINNVIKNLQNSNSNHKRYDDDDDDDDFLITEFKIDYCINISLMVINLKLI